MRWCALALCAGVLLGTDACGPLATATAASGQLVFQKDAATCADTVNTELFVDGTSKGQYVLRPGSQQSFTTSADTHIARATELAGGLRQFLDQAISVPAGGAATYLMTCASKPPPIPSPGR